MIINSFLLAGSLILLGCTTTQPVKVEGVGPEKQDYSNAYNELRNGYVPQSIELFKTYLRKYPNSLYAGNAQYWLAEAYRVQQNNSAAYKAFVDEVEKYPNNVKVPDALFRLGMMEIEMNNMVKAREYLSLLISDYSASPLAVSASKKLQQLGLTQIEKIDNPLNFKARQAVSPSIPPPNELQIKPISIDLEGFKDQCKKLGFKAGTTDFGNCVLQLNEGK